MERRRKGREEDLVSKPSVTQGTLVVVISFSKVLECRLFRLDVRYVLVLEVQCLHSVRVFFSHWNNPAGNVKLFPVSNF